MPDLVVAHLFRGAKEAVGGVVDDNIDATQGSERAIDYPAHRLRIGHVQQRDPEVVAILCFQVVEDVHLAQGRRHAIAAGQKLLGQRPSEAGGSAGYEPGLWRCVRFHNAANLPQFRPDAAGCAAKSARAKIWSRSMLFQVAPPKGRRASSSLARLASQVFFLIGYASSRLAQLSNPTGC